MFMEFTALKNIVKAILADFASRPKLMQQYYRFAKDGGHFEHAV